MNKWSLLKFGDVFRHNGEEYIFLKATENIIYAAKVLNDVFSRKVLSSYENEQSKGKKDLESKILFAFVVLSTDQLKERVAHFGKTGENDISSMVEPLGFSISESDIKEIKELIKSSPCIPGELKDLVDL